MNERIATPLICLALGGTLLVPACGNGGGASPPARPTLTIMVNAPFSKLPFVGDFSLQGAELARDQINGAGGIIVSGTAYNVKLDQRDNGLSPATSLENIQAAIAEHAVAVIDDGYTVSATWQTANAAGLPILVDYDGDTSLIDANRPNVFRIAPPDDAVATKLIDYIKSERNLSNIVIVHDDSAYGTDGDTQLKAEMNKQSLTPAADITVPSNATDISAQALQVAQSGATAIVAWAEAPSLAQIIKAVRTAGATAPVFAGPTAEDPVVRTQLADHADWINGVTYASFRITTESGTTAWDNFRAAYENHNFNQGGPDYHVGVKASDGKLVVQPPDWEIFPYDMVELVKAALQKAGVTQPSGTKLIDALNQVQVKSGNGDNRGWTKDDHEGVVDDDIYFATFQDMKFKPVQDDPLSKSLPPIDQE